MILILIALGCGLIASIGISQVMESQKGSSNEAKLEMQAIYVAMTDIPLGEPLTAAMIQLEEWPKDRVPYGAILKLEEIEGRMPRQPLYKGEPILAAKLIDPKRDQGVASSNIAPGYSAFSIRVDMESGASNLIQPGDRVDVLVFLPTSPGVPQTTVKTILKDVTVFAVNEQISRTTDQGETTVSAKTVTLQVTPEDVEKLMLAKNLGRMALSLRRPTDEERDDHTPGATLADLDPARESSTRDFAFNPPPAGPLSPAAPSGLFGFLNKITQSAVPGSDSKGNLLFSGQPEAQMAVITPEGISTFTWSDRNSLPLEVSAQDPSNAAPLAAPAPSALPLDAPPPGVTLPEEFLPSQPPTVPSADPIQPPPGRSPAI
jgi:pilus assembly protein CpaB